MAPCLRVDPSAAVPQREAGPAFSLRLQSKKPRVEKKRAPLRAANYTNTNQMRIKTGSPGGPAANILAAAAHIAHALTDDCSCALPVENADRSEIGLFPKDRQCLWC